MMYSTALSYFVEVARTGSIASAAEELSVTVSAVSRQIARLEQQLGGPLFERMPRGMALTQSGKILAQHARRALLEARAVISEISSDGPRAAQVVRIGFTGDFSLSIVPTVMADFRRSFPQARLIAREQLPQVIERWVSEGEVDLGLFYSTSDSAAVNTLLRAKEPACALCRRDHPLARKHSITLEEVLAYPLVLPPPGTTVRQLFDLCCSGRGLKVDPMLVSNSAAVQLTLVRMTDGVAIGSRIMLSGSRNDAPLVARGIDEPLLNERYLRLTAMQGRRLPQIVSRFVDFLAAALSGERNSNFITDEP